MINYILESRIHTLLLKSHMTCRVVVPQPSPMSNATVQKFLSGQQQRLLLFCAHRQGTPVAYAPVACFAMTHARLRLIIHAAWAIANIEGPIWVLGRPIRRRHQRVALFAG